MSDRHPHQIHPDGVSQNHRETQKHPRQIGRPKIKQSKEIHPNKWIPSGPHIDKHQGERLPQKQQIHKKRKNLKQKIKKKTEYNQLDVVNTEKTTKFRVTVIKMPPNINIITKSALRPRNEPSSSIRQYLQVNIMLKRKLKPTVPKKRNVVRSLHI